MWTSAWNKNYSYHICKIYSDNLAVCLYIKLTSWSIPSFSMLLTKVCNRNTHVCTSSIRMVSFFLPFSLNCSQVAMFQIMPALCLHGQGEGRGDQTNVDTSGQGEGVRKALNLCRYPLWMTPVGESGFLRQAQFFRCPHLIFSK